MNLKQDPTRTGVLGPKMTTQDWQPPKKSINKVYHSQPTMETEAYDRRAILAAVDTGTVLRFVKMVYDAKLQIATQILATHNTHENNPRRVPRVFGNESKWTTWPWEVEKL